MDNSLSTSLYNMSQDDIEKNYAYLQQAIEKLNPYSKQHISAFPYGVTYSRSKMFDIMVQNEDIEAEELLYQLLDDSFMTPFYRGPYKQINDNICQQIEQNAGAGYQNSWVNFREYVLFAALSKAWNRYKVIYQPDMDFIEHLVGASDFEFYPQAFEFLPEKTFYLDYSVSKANIKGLLVNVDRIDDKIVIYAAFCTEDMVNKMDTMHFMTGSEKIRPFIISMLDAETPIRFSEWINSEGAVAFKVPLVKRKRFPFYIKKIKYDIAYIEEDKEQLLYIREALIKLLLYLSCKEPDIRLDPVIKKKIDRMNRLKKEKIDIPEKWQIGARYGNVIRSEKKIKSKEEYLGGTHASPRTHIRSAHFHSYWTGKGRETLRVNFVSTIIVNGTSSDLIPVVHKVTDIEPKGSIGEEMIKEYLIKNDIPFKRERYIGKIKKRYDFAIKIHKQICFIEFDGEQHFKSIQNWGGRAAYNERRKSDQEKNEYCKKNSIPLLRIRFDQKASLTSIMDEFVENPWMNSLNTLMTDQEYYSICQDSDSI